MTTPDKIKISAAQAALKTKKGPLHRRLTTKFVAMALLLFLAPQVLLFYYSSNTASEMLIESLRNDLKEKSFLVGADIDRLFNQRLHDVQILSQADVLETDDIDATIQYLTEVIEATPYLDDIDIIDIDGTIIASSGVQNEQGKNILQLFPSLRHIFIDVLVAKQGDMFVSDILKLDSGPGVAILTPITDDLNINVIKILLVEINLDTVKKIVADFNDRVIGDKYVYLVDNDGRVIVSADPETSLLSPYPDLSVQPDLLRNFSQQGDVGSIIYQDASGEEVMAGFADMAEFGVNMAMDWSIIAVAPIKDITAPVTDFKNSLLTITVLIFILVAVAMFMMARGIIGSVMKLVEGASRVGSGEIKFRIDLPQDDEFGYLATTINQTLDNLVSARVKAESSAHAKSEFLASMSHEIRTPMAGIMGMADLILDCAIKPQVLNWAAYIKDSSHHLMKILNEILDQSKLEAGKIHIDPVDFHLASFIKNTTDLFLPKMASKGLKLDINISEKLPEGICADSLRIGQILNNLLSNALKFTDTGCISVHLDPDPINNGELLLRFTILDTGIGISEKVLGAIFTPFTQADSSTSRKYGGTGLGLSISKQLVNLMGGDIGVSSVEGIGSRFWFTIPCQPAKSRVDAIDRSSNITRWKASRVLKILVAEDTDVIQEWIRVIFEGLNHELVITPNGKEAIEYFEAEDFDIVLMDIRMPIMDGLEATSIIRAMDGEKSNIPIIALTADVSTGNIKKYIDMGISSVCAKPIELKLLLRTIDALLGVGIHKAVPQAPLATQDRQATNTKDSSELAVNDASFVQILEDVSNIVDDSSESIEENSTPVSNYAGLAADKMTRLLAKYENNLIEKCGKLKTAFDDLAENSTNDELRGEVSSMIHSMKGGGGTYGYHLITTIATDADELLKVKNTLNAEAINTIGNHVQALSLIARKRLSGNGGSAGRMLLQGLKEFS